MAAPRNNWLTLGDNILRLLLLSIQVAGLRGLPIPPAGKVLAWPGLEPGSSFYMIYALPTELLIDVLQGVTIPPARKVLARPGLEPGSSIYMIAALPTELLTTPAEMNDLTLTDDS